MSSRLSPPRIIGNLAAVVATVLVAAFLFDASAGCFGYAPRTLCILLPMVTTIAYGAGVLITAIGTVISIISLGKNQAGNALALGGVMLFILPLVLPHYLGAECIP